MYGFWSDGLRPRPSAGASCVSNGLAANTSIDAKNPAVPARIAVTQGISSGFERRFVTSTVAVKPASTVSQSSSEPGCEAQNEVTRYAVGSFRELVSATVWNEKSWPRMALMNTASATSTAPSIAYTARRADRIRRRSRLRAPITAVTQA